MEDFNADNQKIDTILGELQNRTMIDKLADVTVTSSGVKSINMDLSDYAMGAYQMLWLSFAAGTYPNDYSLCCTVNHLETDSSYLYSPVSADMNSYWMLDPLPTTFSRYVGHLTFYMNSKDTLEWTDMLLRFRVKPSSWSTNYPVETGGLAPANLNSIQIKYDNDGSENFPIGNRYTLLGLRRF
jgi:hypothetical protein